MTLKCIKDVYLDSDETRRVFTKDESYDVIEVIGAKVHDNELKEHEVEHAFLKEHFVEAQ